MLESNPFTLISKYTRIMRRPNITTKIHTIFIFSRFADSGQMSRYLRNTNSERHVEIRCVLCDHKTKYTNITKLHDICSYLID